MRTLVAIPVFNEASHVRKVVSRVLDFVGNVLIVDDGSSDQTPDLVREFPVDVIRHAINRGYGRSVADAFRWAAADGYDWIITMDCDEQHEPDRIPDFLRVQEANGADIISGSRYMQPTGVPTNGNAAVGLAVPPDRRRINHVITAELNERFGPVLGTKLTDSFCGFKSHRVSAIRELRLTEDGYAFPMQLWVQAAAMGLRVQEIPVELIYNDPNRTFGDLLDNPEVRLRHYRDVLKREINREADRLPASALRGLCCGCNCQ
ncbi:MAG: glycosyltransferase family 2 protein [Phycisphaerales bacterium]|nr:glycosyltransferase family 2 protein [Phycisphaerales bacterium]